MIFKYFNKFLFILFLGTLVFTSSQTLCMNENNPEDSISEINYDYNKKEEANDNSPVIKNNELIVAIENNKLEKVKEIIAKNPSLVNAKLACNCRMTYPGLACHKWYRALILAVKSNNLEIIKLLLKNGANENLKDSEEKTPLQLAFWLNDLQAPQNNAPIKNSRLPIIQLFLKNGTNIPSGMELLRENKTSILNTETAEILTKTGFNIMKNDQLVPVVCLMEFEILHSINDVNSYSEKIHGYINLINFLIDIGVGLNSYNCHNYDCYNRSNLKEHIILEKINAGINTAIRLKKTPTVAIFYEQIETDLKNLLNKFFTNGANFVNNNKLYSNFQKTDNCLNKELYDLSKKLNEFVSEDQEKLDNLETMYNDCLNLGNCTPDIITSQIVMLDLTDILKKTIKCINTIPEKIENAANKIKEIIRTNNEVSPYDKLMALSYLSGIKFVNQKGELLNLIADYEIPEYLKYIPFNYNFFFNSNCKYLRARVLEMPDNRAIDITGKTITEAMCNYQEFTPVVFARKHTDYIYFDENKNPIATEDLKSILFNQENLINLINLVQKIIPITQENITTEVDKSYRHNKFHKKFVNSCSLFTILCCQATGVQSNIHSLPIDIFEKIMAYTDGTLANGTRVTKNHKTGEILNPDASYLPSRNIIPEIKVAEKYKENWQQELAQNKKTKATKKTEL